MSVSRAGERRVAWNPIAFKATGQGPCGLSQRDQPLSDFKHQDPAIQVRRREAAACPLADWTQPMISDVHDVVGGGRRARGRA